MQSRADVIGHLGSFSRLEAIVAPVPSPLMSLDRVDVGDGHLLRVLNG